MDNELLPDRIKQAVARDEREHMKPSKKKERMEQGKGAAAKLPFTQTVS